MHEEMDPGIQRLFQEQSRTLADEPFLINTLHCLKRRQARQAFLRRILFVLSLASCALLSSFFVRGSILLSDYIDLGFEHIEGFLEMPLGTWTAVLCGVLLVILEGRRLIFALVRQA